MFLGVFIAFISITVVVWVFMARHVIYALRHFTLTRPLQLTKSIEKIPSVSVCIPARNEMHAMTECLESVLKSDYPKMEVIVLDDRSEDTTSTLVKAFAHEGVRFVEGKKIPLGWLGKNYALQALLNEASGTYILFMDVDTRLQPGSISQMMSYMLSEKATMLSVMPRREDGWRASVIFAPLRYFWEIVFHSRTTPATASNAWIIKRQELIDGFEPYKSAIQPESKLASRFMAQHTYRFLLSHSVVGVSYAKKWSSQIETSIRLLYPLLGSQVVRCIGALIALLFLLTPSIVLIDTIQTGWTFMQTICMIIAVAYTLLYGVYLKQVWRRGWWLGALLWPVIIVQEFFLIVFSIERYLTKTVTWKGRPVVTRS